MRSTHLLLDLIQQCRDISCVVFRNHIAGRLSTKAKALGVDWMEISASHFVSAEESEPV